MVIKKPVLHTFSGQIEGIGTESAVVFDSGGIFRMTFSGQGWSVELIHDGGHALGTDLNFDAAGNIYGVRIGQNGGEAFKLSESDGSWTYTLLHTFNGGTEGAAPYEGMEMDTNGNLWGTASVGGAHNYGLVYEITP
jgi:uncharacterized repeat protein (TIGR03803 family)